MYTRSIRRHTPLSDPGVDKRSLKARVGPNQEHQVSFLRAKVHVEESYTVAQKHSLDRH